MIFDTIEPLDAPGLILKGLSGQGKGALKSSSSNWKTQQAKMMNYLVNVKGKIPGKR